MLRSWTLKHYSGCAALLLCHESQRRSENQRCAPLVLCSCLKHASNRMGMGSEVRVHGIFPKPWWIVRRSTERRYLGHTARGRGRPGRPWRAACTARRCARACWLSSRSAALRSSRTWAGAIRVTSSSQPGRVESWRGACHSHSCCDRSRDSNAGSARTRHPHCTGPRPVDCSSGRSTTSGAPVVRHTAGKANQLIYRLCLRLIAQAHMDRPTRSVKHRVADRGNRLAPARPGHDSRWPAPDFAHTVERKARSGVAAGQIGTSQPGRL
jgi:hypothetical protein